MPEHVCLITDGRVAVSCKQPRFVVAGVVAGKGDLLEMGCRCKAGSKVLFL